MNEPMRIETTVEVERWNEADDDFTDETLHVVADVDLSKEGDVTLIEPTASELRGRFEARTIARICDAAWAAAERKERAAQRSKALVDDFLNTARLMAQVARAG